MVFITIWTATAKDLIRDILIQDINNDKKTEVIYSSWDGNIYAVQGNTGTRIWISKSNIYTGPAEKLIEIKLSPRKKYIAATKHKYLLIIDGETGNIEFAENFGSWIKDAIPCDFDCDGRTEIALLTRRNELYVVDDNGEIIFRKELNSDRTLHQIALSALKECVCPNILACSSNITSMYHYSRDFLTEITFNSPILSIGRGKILPDLRYGSIIGLKDSIKIIGDNNFSVEFKENNFLPYIIETGDIDGDFQDEIIVGDWSKDSIFIFKISTKKTLKRLFRIGLGGNPINISSADVNGDGKDEVLVFVDKQENNFLIIDPYKKSKIIFSSDTYPSSSGLRIGDVLGYGFGDIIYRSGREKISLLIHVPRINTPTVIEEKKDFEINLVTQSKDKIVSPKGIEISSKKIKATRTKLAIGWITLSKTIGKALNHGKKWLKIQRGKRTLIQRPIIVSSDRKIDLSVISLYCLDEDIISLDNHISSMAVPEEYKGFLSIQKIDPRNNRYHISVSSEHYLRPRIILKIGGKEVKRDIILIKKKSIEYEVIYKDYYLQRDFLELIVRNLSPINLRLVIEGDEVIAAPSDKIILPGTSSKKLRLNIIYEPEKITEKVFSSLKLIYEGNKKHCVQIPLELNILNAKKIKNLADEILALKKGINELYNIVASKTKLPVKLVKEILSRISTSDS